MTTPRTPLATSASVGPRCWPTAVPALPAAPARPARNPHGTTHADRAREARLPLLGSAGQTKAGCDSGSALPTLGLGASVRSPSRRRGSGAGDHGTRSDTLRVHRFPGGAHTNSVPATRSPLPPGGIGSIPPLGSAPRLPVPPNTPLTLPAVSCSYIPWRCSPSLGALMRPRYWVLGRVHRLCHFYTVFEGSSPPILFFLILTIEIKSRISERICAAEVAHNRSAATRG